VRTPADGSGSEIEYTYDELGRVLDIIVHRRNGLLVNEWFSYGYNETGLIEWVCLPNGGCADYEYDELNRLVELINSDEQSNVLSRFLYEYDDEGMRTKVTETDELGTVTVIEWGYDNINRLTGEDFTVDSVPGDSYGHVYDLVGNRLSKTVNSNETTYTYNSNDQLTCEVSPTETTDYYYDLNGSVIQKDVVDGDVTDYFYNFQNRLSEVRVNDSLVAQYLYNPDGIRVEKYDGTDTTSYLVDPYNLTGYPQTLKETIDSSSRVYIIGSDILAQADGSDDLESFLYDGHGSVRQLADSDCTIAETYDYDAYGNAAGFNPGAASTNLLYTGEPYDPESGMYYLDARYYDTATIQFNRIDPFNGNILNPQSLHDYMYCHGNPVNGYDPAGRFFSSPYHGRIVHKKIGYHFTRSSANDRLADRRINTILGTNIPPWFWGWDRPDLVDRDTGEIWEIKPLGMYTLGTTQLSWYLLLLNTYDPQERVWKPGFSYFPPPVIEIDPFSYAIVFFPKFGVIEYEVIEFRVITSLITSYYIYRLETDVTMKTLQGALLPI